MWKKIYKKIAKNKNILQLWRRCGKICGKGFPRKNQIFHREINY